MPRRDALIETAVAFAVVLCIFLSVPLQRGGIGLSWDSVNHHIYLGWVADAARFEQDYFAAGSQSYQYPYLYWPIYKMASLGWSGHVAGLVWALLHTAVCFPLVHISRSLIQGEDMMAAVFRFGSVMLGVGTILVLRAPETTGNDVLAAMPLLCALAVGLRVHAAEGRLSDRQVRVRALSMGLLGGVATAFKLSNGFFVPALAILTVFFPGRWRHRFVCVLCCLMASAAGFGLTYGWWGYQLWLHFGNPVFPFYDDAFSLVRGIFGWQPLRGS